MKAIERTKGKGPSLQDLFDEAPVHVAGLRKPVARGSEDPTCRTRFTRSCRTSAPIISRSAALGCTKKYLFESTEIA